ncbi:uncharacterized protein [Battus philenor]|uniref:uncharacterized protein n=1 Tax=Battus philenor TaxID=42288 RepID=UPI0035D03D20
MYRSVFLLTLCFYTCSTAPQQSSLETIADVRPTIFDYPAVVYDDERRPYRQTHVFNGGRQDSSSDDFNYDIATTENIELDTTEYVDESSVGYDPITETLPTDDYEIEKKTNRFYSKIGYLLNPYLVEDNLNDLGISKNAEKKTNVDEEKINYNEASNDADNIIPVKEVNSSIIHDVQTDKAKNITNTADIDTIVNKTNIINISSHDDKPNFIPEKPKYAVGKPSFYSASPKIGYTTANLIQKSGKRKFRSNCRCEKIWNCPRLQISVPRCPNEYFMCCF